VGVVDGFALATARQFRIQVVQAMCSCPRAERRAGGDGRTRTRLKAAEGCGMGAALPLRSLLGKAEKMGSRLKACGFSTIFTKGDGPICT